MLFDIFAKTLSKLEKTPSRLAMTEQLAELFSQLEYDEVPQTMYLLQGGLVPQYQRLEFQLSTTMVLKALALVVGASIDEETLKKRFKEVGDIGELAQSVMEAALESSSQENQSNQGSLSSQSKQASSGDLANQFSQNHQINQLTILDVYNQLVGIAKESGQGSQQRKLALLAHLLCRLTPESAKYVARIVVGKLRLGFSTMTMIDALSWVHHGNKQDSSKLEARFNRKADIGSLAQEYLSLQVAATQVGVAQEKEKTRSAFFADMQTQVGIPVVPALCQRLNSAQEIIDKLGTVIAEPKYDGLRIQIHFDRKAHTVYAYTRNLEDVSHMFPELHEAFAALDVDSVILDGEAIGYDPATDSLRAFQETITRRRKHSVSDLAEKIPIRFYIYDVLYYDGTSLLDKKLQDRKDSLISIIKDNGVYFVTPRIITNDPVELRQFHEEQLALGFEGAVIKRIDSPYVSGRKGWHWVKIKEEEGTTGKLADTVDCVVMGYYAGRGKRAQFGIGALLVGLTNTNTDTIQTVAKIGTGLTEQQLVDIKEMCDAQKSAGKPTQYEIPKELLPDVFVQPAIVLEIAADEVTKSPLHSAGSALRFPRLTSVRLDKSWQQATTVEELSALNLAHLQK